MRLFPYVRLVNIHNSTGAGRVARNLLESMYDVREAGDEWGILGQRGEHSETVAKVGGVWSRFRYHLFDFPTSLQQARWLLSHSPGAERYWSDAEVVFATHESYVPTRKARLAVTLHDAAYFEDHAHDTKQFSVLRQRWKWKCLYRVLEDRADLFHTVSSFSADRLAHFFPRIASRLRVIPNGVVSRFFERVSDAGEAGLVSHGLANECFVLVPGGLHFRKNADFILKTWRRIRETHPNILLVVAGVNDPVYEAKALSLKDSRLRLLGRVDDELLCSLYTAARVVWVPSRYEGFGMPALEAMACGTPVVANRCSSLPEVCGDAAILAAPDNPNEHIEAIREAADDEVTRAELSRRGRERAKLFTWKRAAEEMSRCLRGLV